MSPSTANCANPDPLPSSSSAFPSSSHTDDEYHSFCPQTQYINGKNNNQRYHRSVKDSNRFSVFNSNHLNM